MEPCGSWEISTVLLLWREGYDLVRQSGFVIPGAWQRKRMTGIRVTGKDRCMAGREAEGTEFQNAGEIEELITSGNWGDIVIEEPRVLAFNGKKRNQGTGNVQSLCSDNLGWKDQENKSRGKRSVNT